MQNRRSFTHRTLRRSHVASRAALLGATAAASVMAFGAEASAQQFPFPSSNAQTGNDRFTTSVLTAPEIQALYDQWRQNFIRQCPGNQLRVIYPENTDPPNDTRSEGIGYGMVIAAYMGDEATFDGLRNYYFGHLDSNGLMNWKYNDCNQLGNNGQGSAADADVDAAFALIVANRQWPGQGYAADAVQLIGSIRNRLFLAQCSGILLAGSDNGIRNCGCINPSYIPPGYYPAFGSADAANAATWTSARTASYSYFESVSNPNTGLVPAWSNSGGGLNLSGCNPEVSGGGAPSEFQADAARTPWRVATDYLWSGNANARTFLQEIADFANRQPRIVHLVDRYQLGGAPLEPANVGNGQLNAATLDATGRRSSFTMGGFTTAMMASSQADLDAFTGAWVSMYLPGDNVGQPRAFGSSLALLYGLLVTGYMWDPISATAPTPRLPPAPTPPVAGNALVNGDFDDGFLGWTMENIGGIASEGYAMHLNGEMHLRNQRAAGAPTPWHLRLSQFVSITAGQRYRISVRARAAEPRLMRLIVAQVNEPFATYLAFDDNPDEEGTSFTVDTEMRTYEIVAQAAVSDANARFTFELADALPELIIDDVIFQPTDEPVRGLVPGGTPDPGAPNPGDPGNPNPGGGADPTGNDNGGQFIPNPGGDPGSSGGGVGGPVSGGQTGGLPPPPATGPGGNGICSTNADCGGFLCSTVLGLCYEPQYGYVWDASLNGGQGGWAQPPPHNCGAQYVYWPLSNACYDPESGYIFNPQTNQWQYFGDYYTAGQDDVGADDSGCAVLSGAPSDSGYGFWGTLFAAAGVGLYQRRRARRVRAAG